MIKYLELAFSQEVYEYLEELDEMNWSARGNVLNQYLRNTSIGTTVTKLFDLGLTNSFDQVPRNIHTLPSIIVNFLLNSLNAPITFVVCATNQS